MNNKYKNTGKKRVPGIRFLFLICAAFIAIGLDLATSKKYTTTADTYRFESDFDAVTGASTKVAIVPSDYEELENPVSRSVNPSYSQIEEMVRKAIELQGGLDWVIHPGDEVLLKVNLVGGDSPSGMGENTDVRVVKALIKIIDDHTEGDVDIIVAEGTARKNDVVDEAGSVWDNSGYQDLLSDPYLSGINFKLFNLNQSYEDLLEVTLGNKATAAPHNGSYFVHRQELKADVFIVVPVLKIHDTGLTNALKNQIGTAPAAYYGYNKMKGSAYYGGLVHDVDHRRWTTEEIVDLCTIADIDFVVVDAIMCLEKYKKYEGDNQVRFNTILAGADPVAIDHVSARLLGLNPDDIAHITLSEKIGLGTNNVDEIEIVGSEINEVRKQVIKNNSSNGKFGQSNRTWLLSNHFTSTDMTEELIPGEAILKPVAGEAGWTEAVYFFDDRIDLLSFYEEAEDIISYAFSYFSSPQGQEAELWIGAHEDIIVYINGEEVYSFSGVNVFGDNVLHTDRVNINIKEGVNTLLVKTLNQFGDYSFCLNICEVETNPNWEGNRVDGLEFFTSGNGDDPNRIDSKDQFMDEPLLWPNPSSEELNISISIPFPADVKIIISDISGNEVAKITDRYLNQGRHNFVWDLSGFRKNKVPRGVYFCTFRINTHYVSSKKLIVH